ncbi:MAG: histone deacetylase [Candidatus Marinimicrobia bacterium]|nr:histone deacetylase [Candidatus Neomarinimicrobiota bacterium]
MNIYYHSLYTYGIDENSTFPRERYELIRNSLETEFNKKLINFIEPNKANIEDIYLAHDKDYVDRFISSNLTNKEIRKIGLKPWTNNIIDRTLFIAGGSLNALEDIYRGENVACNLAGGTHHAHKDMGSGFCIFNDLAICAKKAILDYNFKKVLIIDLDVHQGDGTASILRDQDNIYTFSMHCEKNFPFIKEKSDFDVALKKYMTDDDYLKILIESLNLLDSIESDIIFFQAGVDTLISDRYGKLNLSAECLEERNNCVFEFSKKRKNPLLIFMGGGYSSPIDHTVNSFKDLFVQASHYYF